MSLSYSTVARPAGLSDLQLSEKDDQNEKLMRAGILQ